MTREPFRDRDAAKAGPYPAEVIAYWKAKGLKVGFDYRDVWREEHHYSFSAAKIMRLDVLEAMRDEVEKAFAEGLTFESFKKSVEPRMRALGWWDEHEVTDPETGKVVKVNPPNRLRTIYQTNMRTARAAGQWDRIQRSVKSRPYLLYQVGPSARHREQHLAWHGLLLPVDDPFWQAAFPPNGWGCKCRVRAVSKREADELDREGVLAPDPEPVLDPATGLPTGHVVNKRVPVVRTAPELPLVPWHNKRSGKVEFVPLGIDPGFDRPPNVARSSALGGSTPPPANTQTKPPPVRPAPTPDAPEYWHATYTAKYGDAAGRAVAWGRAMEERGRKLEVSDAFETMSTLEAVRIGTRGNPRATPHDSTFLASVGSHPSPNVRAAKTLGEVIEALEGHVARGEATVRIEEELHQARAVAAIVGQARSVDAPSSLPYPTPKVTTRTLRAPERKQYAKQLDEALDVYRTLGDKSVVHPSGYTITHKVGSRGWQRAATNEIEVGDRPAVYAHEVGHALEAANPDMLARSLAFLDARTKGEALQKLSAITGNRAYGPTEVSRPDQFVSAYIGKDYGGRATEVVSMGVELVVQGKAAELLERDPEFLWFILGQLAGDKL